MVGKTLGKGEVVSSILTGSTRNRSQIMGLDVARYGAADHILARFDASTREHPQNSRTNPVQENLP